MKISSTKALIQITLLVGIILSSASSFAAASSTSVIPVVKNPITNKSTKAGLVIVSTQVQDNTDPISKAPIPDRLALKIRNVSANTITNFEIYYTMVDQTTKASESYYQKLY